MKKPKLFQKYFGWADFNYTKISFLDDMLVHIFEVYFIKAAKNAHFIKFKFFQLFLELTWKKLIFLNLKITWVEKSWCHNCCFDPTRVECWKGFKALTQKNLKFNSTRQVKLNIGSEVPTLVRIVNFRNMRHSSGYRVEMISDTFYGWPDISIIVSCFWASHEDDFN